MKSNYCQPDHAEKVVYYIQSINTAVCNECKQKYIKEGHQLISIASMGNSYLCDIRSLKDKLNLIFDEICSYQAKCHLMYEKIRDSVSGSFDSFIAEVNKLKDSIIQDISLDNEKSKKEFNDNVLETKNSLKFQSEELVSHIHNLESFLNASSLPLLLQVIDTYDVPSKISEINLIRGKIDTYTTVDPIPPFVINKRQINFDQILNQVGISKTLNLPPVQQTIESPIYSKRQEIYIPEKSNLQHSSLNSPLREVPPLFNPIELDNLPILHFFTFSTLCIYDLRNEKKFCFDIPDPSIFPSKFFPSIIANDSIFLCGGSTQDNLTLRTAYCFDYSKMIFIQKKSMVNAREKHSLANVQNEFIYALGGIKIKNASRDCIKYNYSLDIWDFAPPLNEAKCLMAAFTYSGRMIYTIGGTNSSITGASDTIERLDTNHEDKGWIRVEFITNGWTPRYGMNSCKLSDQYFLLFGGGNIKLLSHAFLYDCENDKLMYTSKMQQEAKFEIQQSQPILFKDSVYAIDDDRNLHIFNVLGNNWRMVNWMNWKPDNYRSPKIRSNFLQ